MSISIPELLTNDGFITAGERDAIEKYSVESGLSFIKIALTLGYISRKNYDRSILNAGYHIHEAPRKEAYDTRVLSKIDLNFAHERLAMPLRIENNKVVCLMASPDDTLFIDFIRFTYDLEPHIIIASDMDITWLSNKLLGDKYIKSAVFELMKRDPDSSAVVTFSTAQLIFIFVLLGIVTIGLILSFKNTSIIINVLISSFFLVAIIFKLFLALVGSRFELHQAVTKDDLKLVYDDDLPIYTILLPVYKEDKLIKKLIWNLQSIDYPRHKLDIKLLIEEDDDKTFNAVKNLDFPAIFEVIVVPFHMPKTKPKACNYGLHFARGKYLTIYD
ncbi:MAG: glycosyl transferase, partial [Mucilaginibacter sp.]|nr:glycosyl transferase [Mucilaginibacter sp.]